MILRIMAGIFLIWGFGFIWFAAMPPPPADDVETDAVIVVTGDLGRIKRGIDILERGLADELLISGVNPKVQPEEFAAEFGLSQRLMHCCVELGFTAVDTRGNAAEIRQWATTRQHRTLRLVTSDWHMRRAASVVGDALPASIIVVRDAVPTRPQISVLLVEYHKLLVTELAALAGL